MTPLDVKRLDRVMNPRTVASEVERRRSGGRPWRAVRRGMEEEPSYCTSCRGPLAPEEVEGRQRLRCQGCRRVVYLNPKLVAAAVVLDGQSVLLVRRDLHPGRGRWALPGGYVDRGEVVEEAVRREVLEETGLRVAVLGLVGLYSEDGSHIVLAAFGAEATGGELSDASPEVQAVGLFPLDTLPPLAFPRDARVVREWCRRVGPAAERANGPAKRP